MPVSATFDYVATIPDGFSEGPFCSLRVKLGERINGVFESSQNSRLTGHSPSLQIADAEPMSNPSSARPAVLRSRFTLTASQKKNSAVSSASFYVDRNLKRVFQPGDRLHMVRSSAAGLGLSLLRGGRLVFAIGAISAVPLGSEIQASVSHDLASEAERPFKQRDPGFQFREIPIEISFAGRSHILFTGRRRVGNYEISIDHGFLPGLPGIDECASISLNGACGLNVASVSAQILGLGELEMTSW